MKRDGGRILYNAIDGIDEKWIRLADEPVQAKKENRHFVGYELKKLFGIRYLWVFLVILLLLNSGIAWYTASNTYAASEPNGMIAEFFALYFENPDELDAHYAEMQAFEAQQHAIFMEMMRNGSRDYEMEEMPDIYSTDGDFSDRELFGVLYRAVDAAREYPEVITAVIERARANLAEFSAMGVSEDSFTYRYQTRVIALYELARDNVKIGIEYTRGWDEYFDYDLVNVFLFIMVIMLGSVIFAEEKQTGILPIIRTAKHGRARTALAKVLTMLLLTAAFTMLFTVTTWAVYGAVLGYSSTANAIQALPTFTLSQYQITIGEYFAVTIGVRLLTFCAFGMLMLLLSTVFSGYILIYLSGLGLFGVNFLLYTLKYINANAIAKNANMVASAAVNPLFVRYRAVNFFGQMIGCVPFLCVLFSVLIIGCAALTVYSFVRGGFMIRPVWLDAPAAFCMTTAARIRAKLTEIPSLSTKTKRKNRAYSLSLLSAEAFKTLISSRFIWIVLLLLVVKCGFSADVYRPTGSYADAVYHEYMTELYGPVTDEKLEFIDSERAAISEILGQKTAMEEAYRNGEIGFEEYREYLSEYNYAYSRDELFVSIENQRDYLIRLKDETGTDGWFLYDTGWRKLLTGDADLFLYASVLLLLTGSFAAEYASRSSSGSFAQILRSTKKGREETFRAKLISAGIIAVTLAVLFGTADFAAVFAGYDMPGSAAPIQSIPIFADVTGGMTVGAYLGVFWILRISGAFLMAMLVCALSELLCRYIPVLGSAVVLTMLPALCAYFGLKAAEKISFLNLLAGTPLVLQSSSAALFGSGWTMLAVWILAVSAAVWCMMLSARKMFVKG